MAILKAKVIPLFHMSEFEIIICSHKDEIENDLSSMLYALHADYRQLYHSTSAVEIMSFTIIKAVQHKWHCRVIMQISTRNQ